MASGSGGGGPSSSGTGGAGPSTPAQELRRLESVIATTLEPNADYPANLQKPTCVVTNEDPWNGEFSKDRRYTHTNQRNDHRFRREHRQVYPEGRRYVPNLEQYIRDNNHADVYDVTRLNMMVTREENLLTVEGRCLTDNNTREGSWEAMWHHLGRFVEYGEPYPGLPSDTAYYRHSSEVQYHRDMRRTLRSFLEADAYRAEYRDELTRSNLPRPITSYYMFQRYEGWHEDGFFEKRKRVPREDAARLQTPFYVGWSNNSMYAVPVNLRTTVYLRTPQNILNIETSDLLPTPSCPAVAYGIGQYFSNDEHFKALCRDYFSNEQAEINLTSFVYAGAYGIPTSRFSDPRITTSIDQNLGVLTPMPTELVDLATPEMMVNLFYNSHMDPALAHVMAWRTDEIDWTVTGENLERPFCWYNFKTCTIVDLPQMEEREPHFKNTATGRKLSWWRVRVWRAVRPTWKADRPGEFMTYQAARYEIDEVLRERGHIPPTAPRSELMEIEPQQVVETALMRNQEQGDGPWLEQAVEAIRPVLREYDVNDPRSVQEMVDMVRGVLARERQYKTGAAEATRREDIQNTRIAELETNVRAAADKLRAEEGLVGRLRAQIQTLRTELREQEETAQNSNTQLQTTLDEVNQRRERDRADHTKTVADLETRVAQLTDARRVAETKKVQELEAALTEQRRINAELRKDNTTASKLIADLQQNVRVGEQHNRAVERSRTEWRTAAQGLLRDLDAYEQREIELLTVTTTLETMYGTTRGGNETIINLLGELARNVAAGDDVVRRAADVLNSINKRRITRTPITMPQSTPPANTGGNAGPGGNSRGGASGGSGTGGGGSAASGGGASASGGGASGGASGSGAASGGA